jgi:hypothetical protein
MTRETHVTRNGHSVELRTLDNGSAQVRSTGFVNTYADATFARRVANIVFLELATGCYACALDKVGRTVMDTHAHSH